MESKTEGFCISILTVYFGLKDKLSLSDIRTFLADYPKIALLPEDYVTAVGLMKNTDHEDALQVAVAERAGCRIIVTLDKKFSDLYKERVNFIVPSRL